MKKFHFDLTAFGRARRPQRAGRAALVAAAICAATVLSPAFADTPDAWLEYIESTSAGKQWIDTGITGRCDTRAEMTIQWLSTSVDGSFLSSRQKSGDFRFILCSNDKYGQYYCGHRDYKTYQVKNTAVSHIESSIAATSATATSVKMTINGTERISYSAGAPLDTGYTMYLFAQHNGAVSSSSDPNQVDLCSAVRCYGVKIWQDGTLVRDYRPCMKDSKAGLYDAVSKDIFFSQSSTDFVDGPVLKPDHFIQYVESTGTQYIDTGIVGRPNTAMQAHILWVSTSDDCFLGSRVDDNDTRFFMYGSNGQHWMAHRKYYKKTDQSVENSVSGSPKTERRLTEPDYISSSILHDGTKVSYSMRVNGTLRINQTRTEEALDTGLNMYVFGCNKGGSLYLPSKIRCYDLKIWQDDVLVRDFRPCVKDGRAGLYDEVSGWIFFPQGGEFNYPNETPDKFVRWAITPGANYVPVAVPAKTGVKAEMKFRPTSNSTVDQYFLAARGANNTDTRFLLNYAYWKTASNNRITIGYRNRWDARSWYNWSVGQDYTLVSEITASGGIAGTLTGYGSPNNVAAPTSGAWDSGLYLYMFAINMGGNAQDYFTGRFHYTKIWEWNEATSAYSLVRDFRPCVKGGYVMFFDDVSQTMFRPYPAIPAKGNVAPSGAMIIAK